MSRQGVPFRYLNERFMDPALCESVTKTIVEQTFPFHWHEFYEMELVIEGEGGHILNGGSYPLHRGSLFLLSPADFHSVYPNPGSVLKLINVKFSDTLLSEALKNLLFSTSGPFVFNIDEESDFLSMQQEFERLYEEHNANRLGSEMIIKGGVERIIIDLLRKGSLSGTASDQIKSSPIQKALSYIHQHFCEPLSLESIAKECHVSVGYFSERFHKETGFMFRNYLQNYRLQAAFSLTMSSDLPIIEVCQASGFHSLAHFHRVFKQKYGQSPSALRKTNGARVDRDRSSS